MPVRLPLRHDDVAVTLVERAECRVGPDHDWRLVPVGQVDPNLIENRPLPGHRSGGNGRHAPGDAVQQLQQLVLQPVHGRAADLFLAVGFVERFVGDEGREGEYGVGENTVGG